VRVRWRVEGRARSLGLPMTTAVSELQSITAVKM
jgi:hypothetical protein